MKLLLATSLISAAFIGYTAFAQEQGEDGARPEGRPAHHGKHGKFGRHMGPGPRRGEMAFKKFDANGDGQVDLEEYMNHARERFDEMDLNGDSLVTAEEAREAHKAMREKHREAMKAAREAYKKSKTEAAE